MTIQSRIGFRRAAARVDVIVAVLVGSVLLCLGVAMSAQDEDRGLQAKSMNNLRVIAVANATYAAEWNDRQHTLVVDDLATYGPNAADALVAYAAANHRNHSEIILGWEGPDLARLNPMDDGNGTLLYPVTFDAAPFGWSRFLNNQRFSQYLTGKFYDPVFYAPKDTQVLAAVKVLGHVASEYKTPPGDEIYWSSYAWSAAALYHPDVMGLAGVDHERTGDPFASPNGFRSPSQAQCRYPNLKTHVIEHHWLQNRPAWAAACDPGVKDGRYRGCEPYYFNHYAMSAPNMGFFDGSIRQYSVNDVLQSDARLREMDPETVGLWLRNPGDAINGYHENRAVDPTGTSFHVFTTQGILGRDLLAGQRHARAPSRTTPAAIDIARLKPVVERIDRLEQEILALKQALRDAVRPR